MVTVDDICKEFNFPKEKIKSQSFAVTIKCNGLEIFNEILAVENLPIYLERLQPISEPKEALW